MRKDPTEFRQRFADWKAGKKVYDGGLPSYEGGTEKVDWKRWDNAELTSYPIDFIEDKAVTLTNAGRATGARLSTNLLDSIADNADRAGLPLETALGIAVKESTLGNPTDDRSAWKLSSGIRKQFNNVYPGTSQYINPGRSLNAREDVINYHKGHLSDDPNSKGKSVLQEAFEFYRKHPDKYNTGLKGYLDAVNKRGSEVMLSPEILTWKTIRDSKKAYQNSRWVRPNPALNKSRFNLPQFKDGKESVRVGDYNVYPSAIGASELNVTTPEVVVTGKDRRPAYQRYDAEHSTYDPNAIRHFTDWAPIIGDIGSGIDFKDAILNNDYITASAIGAGFLLPDAAKKLLTPAIKPIQRFISNAAVRKRMIDAARGFNFTSKWDDDTYMRWLMNGQKTPEFKYVWHGRGTNRGEAKNVVRTYSDKDVGLHLTENKPTAKKFAGDKGVVYQAIDYGIYPDALYPDMGVWRAPEWTEMYNGIDTKRDITNRIKFMQETNMDAPGTFKGHELAEAKREEAYWDIFRDYNLDPQELHRFSHMFDIATDGLERELANKAFANYLSERGVNLRYKNDFEGGGFAKPSSFVTNTSDIHWIPTKIMHISQPKMVPMLDWKTRTIVPGKETWPTYK